ncbi:MAG: helix-turn-helix domain-containing protein [Fimbriimonas sp.]
MKDYLDELVEENLKDPAFAAKWKEVEARTALSAIRKQANLTQEQVAQKMGVARPRVAELERRPLSVSFGRMLAYAKALDIPLEQIIRDLQPTG